MAKSVYAVKMRLLSMLLTLTITACTVTVPVEPPTSTLVTAYPADTPDPLRGSPGLAPSPGPASTVAWSALGLSGKILVAQATRGVWLLDLASGVARTVYSPPDLSTEWVNMAALAPDSQTVVMAFAPLPSPGQVQFGYTALYLLDLADPASLRPLLERKDERESYFTPSWSPDGRYIYYSHLERIANPANATETVSYQYSVERVSYSDGQVEVLVPGAYWPRVSADGTRIVFVTIDPVTLTDSGLFIADADGQNPIRVLEAGPFGAVDAPFFSADGRSLFMSIVSEPLGRRGLGLGTPLRPAPPAHNVPSDWWTLPLGSSTPQRLTQINATGLYGDISPDGRWLGFLSTRGIEVMAPDGSQLTLLSDLGGYGSMDWVP
jgi:Tol biopolymer transport system component